MRRTTSFTLDERQHAFIEERVKAGAYASVSDLVRAAITMLADETEKEATWRASLEAGLSSGRAKAGVFARVRNKRSAT